MQATGSVRTKWQLFVIASNVFTVEHWCPNCDKLFRADLTVDRRGKESTLIESSCPDCGLPGRPLLKYAGS